MRNTKRVVVLVLAGAALFWGYRILFPSDETVIRKLLQRASETAAIRPSDNNLRKLAGLSWLVDTCTETVQLSVGGQGLPSRMVQGREQLRETLAAVRATMQSLSIELIDVGVKVTEDRTSATAQFIARIEADAFQDEVIQEFRVTLERVDGDWKFHRIEPLASLEMRGR